MENLLLDPTTKLPSEEMVLKLAKCLDADANQGLLLRLDAKITKEKNNAKSTN